MALARPAIAGSRLPKVNSSMRFHSSTRLARRAAAVRRADYKAKVGENDVVSFRVIADLEPSAGRALPRLGVRGTAQVSGDDVSLGFYLFRRPITALRQWMGR